MGSRDEGEGGLELDTDEAAASGLELDSELSPPPGLELDDGGPIPARPKRPFSLPDYGAAFLVGIGTLERSALDLLGLDDSALARADPAELRDRAKQMRLKMDNARSKGVELKLTIDRPDVQSRFEEIEAAVAGSDPVGALQALRRLERRSAVLAELARDLVTFVKTDRELQWTERINLEATAAAAGFGSDAVDEAIGRARADGLEFAEQSKADHEAEQAKWRRRGWISLKRCFEPTRPRSLEELWAACIADEVRALDALARGEISRWFEDIGLELEEMSDEERRFVKKLEELARECERGAAAGRSAVLPGGDRTLPVWDFLWASGYPRIHVAPGVTLTSAAEVVGYAASDPSRLLDLLNSGKLADWSRLVLGDAALTQAATVSGGTPVAAAQAWLWLAGSDALVLASAPRPFARPKDLVAWVLSGQWAFEALRAAVADGTLANWLAGLARRGGATPQLVVLAREGASRPGHASADPVRTAFALVRAWEGPVLPLYPRSPTLQPWLVRNSGDLVAAARTDILVLVSAVRSGAFADWVREANLTRAGRPVELPDPSWLGRGDHSDRLVAWTVVWAVSDEPITLIGHGAGGSRSIASIDQLFEAFEAAPSAVVSLLEEGMLVAWLWARGKCESPETPTGVDGVTLIHRVLWALGYRNLATGPGRCVRTPDELRDAIDAEPEAGRQLHLRGLIDPWLTLLRRQDLAERVRIASRAADPWAQELLPQRIAEALGAAPPVLQLETRAAQIRGLMPGTPQSGTIAVKHPGSRGILIAELESAMQGSLRLDVAPGTHVRLAPGQVGDLPFSVALEPDAPSGTLEGILRVQVSTGETATVPVRVERGVPWLPMAIDVLAHGVVGALVLLIVRLYGLLFDPILLGRENPDLGTATLFGAVPTFVVACVGAVPFSNRYRQHLSLVLVGAFCLWCIAMTAIGYGGLILSVRIDGAARAVAAHVVEGSPTGTAFLGWTILGLLIGLASGAHSAVSRAFGGGLGALAGLAVGLVVLIVVSVS